MRSGGDVTWAIILSLIIVLGASLSNESVLPFYSFTFCVGIAGAAYQAISNGPFAALMVSMAVLISMILQAMGEGGERLGAVVYEAPFLFIFFVSFSCLPTMLPWILEDEERQIQAENEHLFQKITELEDAIGLERKEKITDRGAEDKELMVRVTSRTTQLSTFLREVLQAASTKEILHLLFTNTTKSFGALEVTLLTVLEDSKEFLINKAAHPEYGKLEGKRFPYTDAAILNNCRSKNVPTLLPERVVFFVAPEVAARIIVPIVVDGKCEAIITLGKTRQENELEAEDAQFLGSLAELAAHAVSQLKVVLNT